ncbi:hypothetical protein E5676_scaffold119G00140 [Cucumis melo var. makuwa]|uniref:Uncharacterized protein n=1 Tax=Cucumis melo var. makuwa TaxID=1194695 RepID=A0A5A7V3X5_CUCMM|nr:hypothetical protein E6C27_scaffold22G002540 [Cucumis melo var. makuwa]TYK18520.1 hypothetical protein E5676_scaffold119G00140 [Cucumis melo var. makuwa]
MTSSKNDSRVTISSWILFWYLGSRSYDKPTTQKQNKVSRSKSTQNPDGLKIQAHDWSSRENLLFVELGIRNDLKDETYLVAFLSCWLCLFVFPQKESFLRSRVFMAASLMATGAIYSLAVPVLANIYHGLSLITKASNLIGRMDFHFPMHYVHGWGSSALGVPNVPPLSPLNAHVEGLVELDSDESLTGPHVVDSAIEGIGTSKTPVSKPAEQSLRPYALLAEIHRSNMTVGGKSIGSPPSKGDAYPKEPLQKVSSTHAPLKYSESPLDASNRHITRSPEPSQWVGEKVVLNFFKKTALCMWEDIQDKIMRTPFEYIPRLRPEIATVLSGIEKIHTNGLTPLEEYLNSYLKRVDNFNDVQSSYSAQLLSTDKARQLDEKTSAIEEALTLMEKLREDANVIQERAMQLSLEKKELERRLQSLNAESEQLSILSCEKIEAIYQQELEVAKLQDEVNTLEGTPAITEEVIEALAMVRRSMEAAREEFKNFKWKL